MTTSSRTFTAVAVLSLTQLLGWGATFWLIAVTGPAMAADLGLALPVVMAGPTLMLIAMAAVSWPLGQVFERFGARPVMTIGSPLASAGLALMGMANGSTLYFLAWIILGCAGACMLTTPAQIAVTEIAGEKSRSALSFLILAGGLTSTIMWPITSYLQTSCGWRATTLIYALLLFIVCTPLHWLTLSRSPKSKSDTGKSAEPVSIDLKRFVLLATSFAANGFFTWGFALTIIILFEAKGLNHASALAAAAFIGMAQWAGRMADLLVGRRWSGLAMSIAGSALFPLSFVVLIASNSVVGAFVFSTLYGIASGITAVARATLPLELFPPGAYARSAARMSVPLNVAFATAPPVFTVLMTSTSPQAALWVAFAVSLCAFYLLIMLSKTQRAYTLGESA
jgi:MFS family permease